MACIINTTDFDHKHIPVNFPHTNRVTCIAVFMPPLHKAKNRPCYYPLLLFSPPLQIALTTCKQ